VDYLLEVGREVWGIEVKASSSVGRADLRGLNALDGHVRTLKRRIVVFLGDRAQAYDGVEVLPLREFLSLLPA
jgi:predicted AAA+ superfamily ATPase